MPSVAEIDALELGLILAAGFVAGFMNTLAGGGSLLTIPALLFAGLPAQIANATNRVAVVMQSAAAAARFRHSRVYALRESIPMLLPTLFGSVVGAVVAVELDPRVFDVVLALVLLVMAATVLVRGGRRGARGETAGGLTGSGAVGSEERGDTSASASGGPHGDRAGIQAAPARRVAGGLAFFGIGVYGGFVQAGVGFLLISGITLLFGYDLVKTNAVKLLVVAFYSTAALVVFAVNGQVLWVHGAILGMGNVAGAMIGVRFALRRGAQAVRWIILAAVLLSVLELLGIL